MKKTNLLIILITIVFLLQISAHKPIFDDETHETMETALDIKDPDVSQITYHIFTQEEPIFWVTFKGVAGDKIKVVLNIPFKKEYEDYAVHMAVIGPGIVDSLKHTVYKSFDELPFEKPEKAGVNIVDSSEYEKEYFHEPFSNTQSWFILKDHLDIPRDGRFYLAVWPGRDLDYRGRVGVSIGHLERFSPLDLFKMKDWIEGIREFHM